MSDSYKEGYVKGFQDGRVAGVLEVVRWAEYDTRWVESGVVSDIHVTLKRWREESPEAHFGVPGGVVQREEPPPDPSKPPLTSAEATKLVHQYLDSRLDDVHRMRSSGWNAATTYSADGKWRICSTLGCWYLCERTKVVEPADSGAKGAVELYFK